MSFFYFIASLLGITLFFLPGTLLSYIIFQKCDNIERAAFALTLSVCFATLTSLILNYFGWLLLSVIIGTWIFSSIVLLLIIKIKDIQNQTVFNQDIIYIGIFTLIGGLWRLFFRIPIKNHSGAYKYAFKNWNNIPDLEFYTGMVIDHSHYLGTTTTGFVYNALSINNKTISIFLITFLFLSYIYLIFREYRGTSMAKLGVGLMALGPIEIFHTTLSITGHPFSYIALFVTFLYFKSEKRGLNWLLALSVISMLLSYYTASMIMLLSSIGFVAALLLKEVIRSPRSRNNILFAFTQKKVLVFIILFALSMVHITYFSKMSKFISARLPSIEKIELKQPFPTSKVPTQKKTQLLKISRKLLPSTNQTYWLKDPTFLGLSSIGWQSLFFLLCGLTFIIHILLSKVHFLNNIGLAAALIPVSIVSAAFMYANYPARIFDYFAFFGLLVLSIPKKYMKMFTVLSFIFIYYTSYNVMTERRMYFHNSDKVVGGAIWAKKNLKGKIFSDQTFVNSLILNDYTQVSGEGDQSPVVYSLFYQKDPETFRKGINFLLSQKGVAYIATTKKMRKNYILMLDRPQKPLINQSLYDNLLMKIYDNNDVKIYKIR